MPVQVEEWLRYARDVAAHGRPTEVAVTCSTTLARLAGAKAEAAAVNYTPTCADAVELKMAPVEELAGFLGPRCAVIDAAARAAAEVAARAAAEAAARAAAEAAAAAAAAAAATEAARLARLFNDCVILSGRAEAVRSLVGMFARVPALVELKYRATRDGKTLATFHSRVPTRGA